MGPAMLYRRSYDLAFPAVPSSPGAVHRRTTYVRPIEYTRRSVIAEGGVVSPGVVPDGEFDVPDQFGTSSEARTANQYCVPPPRPVTTACSLEPAGSGTGIWTCTAA